MPVQERWVLVAAYLADKVKVREVGGNNRGFWVAKFLAKVGLGSGYAWCAAAQVWAIRTSGYKGELPKGAAAVRNWVVWARKNDLVMQHPMRGDFAYWLNPDGTGHIGVVIEVKGQNLETIEGNTSSGVKGSQRDGNGMYRRNRRIADFDGFIRIR